MKVPSYKGKQYKLSMKQRAYLIRVQDQMTRSNYYSGAIPRILYEDTYYDSDRLYLNHLKKEWPLE